MSIENVQPKESSQRLRAVCVAAARAEIARVLEENRQNRTHAATALGVSRRTLLNKIKEYGLTPRACRELVSQVAAVRACDSGA
jgi:DNA-binding NtrC family response regulator